MRTLVSTIRSTYDAARPTCEWPYASLLRISLIAVCAVSAFAAASLGSPGFAAEVDPELTRLLRAMALIKVAMIGVALAVLRWRFSWPLSPWLGCAYFGGTALTVGASVLIWQLAHIGLAAVLFHVGILALAVAALFDRSKSGA